MPAGTITSMLPPAILLPSYQSLLRSQLGCKYLHLPQNRRTLPFLLRAPSRARVLVVNFVIAGTKGQVGDPVFSERVWWAALLFKECV